MANFMKKFFSMWDPPEEEEYEDVKEEESTSNIKKSNDEQKKDSKVLNIYRGKTQISCFKPSSFDSDIAEIANNLISGNVIVIDLEIEESSPEISRRIIDFLRGTIFAIQGKFVRVSKNTYVLTPNNVDINGPDLINDLATNNIYI